MLDPKIDIIQLHNFRGIRRLDIDLDNITIFVGNNGAGKSTILDAIAILLSWVIARVRHTGASGRLIQEIDIHNQAKYSLLKLQLGSAKNRDEIVQWQLVKGRAGAPKPMESSELQNVSLYAKAIQNNLEQDQTLPTFVYYPVNRAVLDIPLQIRTKHFFDNPLEAHADALTSGVNFRHFFEWFRHREDFENERKLEQLEQDTTIFIDKQLDAVRQALQHFLPDLAEFKVRRIPLRLSVKKRGIEIQVDQLSDGEKCLIAMIGDLARRLAIANPQANEPLKGFGVVLIDEIELHLHPAWQRNLIRQLAQTFPNCQFLLSTHSPQILGEVSGKNVRLLHSKEGEVTCSTPDQALGLDSSEIIEELMNATKRDLDTTKDLSSIFNLIDEENFILARQEISRLKMRLNGSIPEIVRAEALIAMLDRDFVE